MVEEVKEVIKEVNDEELDPAAAQWAEEKTRLNKEASDRRREAKEQKKLAETLTAKIAAIKESLGVENDDEFETKISEIRAAAEKGGKTGNDLVALQGKLTAAEKAAAKYKGDFENKEKEFSSVSGRLNDTLIGHELQKGFSTFDVRDDQREMLEIGLKSKGLVKVNEKGKAVWVVRDEDGDEIGDKSIRDGLAEFFEKYPSYLPASRPEGGDTKPLQKTKPGRTDMSVQGFFGDGIDGYKKRRAELGIGKKASGA